MGRRMNKDIPYRRKGAGYKYSEMLRAWQAAHKSGRTDQARDIAQEHSLKFLRRAA